MNLSSPLFEGFEPHLDYWGGPERTLELMSIIIYSMHAKH